MKQALVGIRELKTRLSRYVQEVKTGVTVVITDRGKPVGRIIPIGSSLEDRLRPLVDSQVLSWSGRKLAPQPPVARIRGSKTVGEMLIEDRGGLSTRLQTAVSADEGRWGVGLVRLRCRLGQFIARQWCAGQNLRQRLVEGSLASTLSPLGQVVQGEQGGHLLSHSCSNELVDRDVISLGQLLHFHV